MEGSGSAVQPDGGIEAEAGAVCPAGHVVDRLMLYCPTCLTPIRPTRARYVPNPTAGSSTIGVGHSVAS